MREKKYDVNKFLTDAYQIHGDKYDYSTTVYTNMSLPVKILCSSHGEFYQRPIEHIRGKGCPICSAKSTVPIHTKSKNMKQLTTRLNPFTIAFIFYSVIFIINYLKL